ncbi:Transposase [Desulfobacula phenolica]|uniref:Transposase n=1 Tax=Desulfobacula phenolica TaxID=90732 RepID=A0A1H2KAX2_9BACT|nr:Transposase [Desulfobacula phenolica]
MLSPRSGFVQQGKLTRMKIPLRSICPVIYNEHTRKKRGRKPLPADLPRIDVIHELSEDERQCNCGCLKERIGQEESEQLDYIPAKVRVLRNIRYKYACKNCEGVEDDGPTVSIARMPEQIIPKSIATPGLLAHILTAKFADALPFYLQEKQFTRIGIELGRSTMCSWAMKVADACDILIDMMQKDILASPMIGVDETPLQVLKGPRKSKSYMWIFRGGTPDKPIIQFQYHPTRSGDVAASFLNGYKGIVQTDGYKGYDFLDKIKDIIHVACWTHARRGFKNVTKAAGNKKSSSGNASTALKYISLLYKIEKEARVQELKPEQLYAQRQKEAVPILEECKRWLDARVEKVPPKSLLGKAIHYTLSQWHRLIQYTTDGIIRPDNNLVENAIRPFVVGRKNWLFSDTVQGARSSALIYSLIETAKSNGMEPYWYMKYLFEHLPEAMTEDDFRALLPYNVDKKLLAVPTP